MPPIKAPNCPQGSKPYSTWATLRPETNDCDCKITDNDDGTFTFEGPDGDTITIDVCAIVTALCPAQGGGAVSVVTDNGDGTFTHNDGDGTSVTLDICQMLADGSCQATVVDNGDGTLTVTGNDGNSEVTKLTSLVDNLNGTYTFTNEAGTVVVIDATGTVSVLTNNGDGTFTHNDGDGTLVNIDVCQMLADGSCQATVVDNGDGTLTVTGNDGSSEVTKLTTLVNNGNGTYTFTNEAGTVTVINAGAGSADGFGGPNSSPAVAAPTVTDNADGTATVTDYLGNSFTFNVALFLEDILDPDLCNPLKRLPGGNFTAVPTALDVGAVTSASSINTPMAGQRGVVLVRGTVDTAGGDVDLAPIISGVSGCNGLTVHLKNIGDNEMVYADAESGVTQRLFQGDVATFSFVGNTAKFSG